MVKFTEMFEIISGYESTVAVPTPTGIEIVVGEECNDDTVVIDRALLETLRRETCRHRHSTVEAFPAVIVP